MIPAPHHLVPRDPSELRVRSTGCRSVVANTMQVSRSNDEPAAWGRPAVESVPAGRPIH